MAVTKGHGNPKWTFEEVVLALDLYIKCEAHIPPETDSRVIELSEFLRALPRHNGATRNQSFRNTAGVVFKLQNLRQVATGKGLDNTSHVDEEVWGRFGSHPEEAQRLAAAIREGVEILREEDPVGGPDEDEFQEGATLTRVHRTHERKRGVREKLIASRVAGGQLRCEICELKPWLDDTELATAMFEAHHNVPLAAGVIRTTRLADMSLLCATCHRVLHRAIVLRKAWIDVAEARAVLGRGFKSGQNQKRNVVDFEDCDHPKEENHHGPLEDF